MSITAKQITQLESYDSATVQNAAVLVQGFVDAAGDYTDPSILRYTETRRCVVGVAATSTWTPITSVADPRADADFWECIEAEAAPVIAVMKDVDSDRLRGAILGDVMANIMAALGACGAVVDGNVRDVLGIEDAGLNMWARARVPGHGPFSLIEHSIKLEVCGLRISPGDVLVCDDDGITRVAPEIVDDVIDACAVVRDKESRRVALTKSPDFTASVWREYKKNNFN
ncbi:MAG: RraA family protein [Lentisphaeria bacterium]